MAEDAPKFWRATLHSGLYRYACLCERVGDLIRVWRVKIVGASEAGLRKVNWRPGKMDYALLTEEVYNRRVAGLPLTNC